MEGRVAADGMHLVNWETMCSLKAKGGLGLHHLVDMNVALLCKWLWRLGSKEEGMWKNLVIEKYGVQDVWRPNMVRSPYGTSIWKGIISHLDSFIKGVGYVAGRGARIAFGEDKWCEATPLKDVFRDIYLLAGNHAAKVVDYMEISSNSVLWSLMLRRNVFDWELPSLFNLLEQLSLMHIG